MEKPNCSVVETSSQSSLVGTRDNREQYITMGREGCMSSPQQTLREWGGGIKSWGRSQNNSEKLYVLLIYCHRSCCGLVCYTHVGRQCELHCIFMWPLVVCISSTTYFFLLKMVHMRLDHTHDYQQRKGFTNLSSVVISKGWLLRLLDSFFTIIYFYILIFIVDALTSLVLISKQWQTLFIYIPQNKKV